MKKEGNKPHMHSGHRQRMKERFARQGIDGFADHEALELLLYYAVPRRDTNELAHVLINEFGSLYGVLDASVDALTSVSGVGESTALLIKLIGAMNSKYLQSKNNGTVQVLDSSEKAGEFFLPMLMNQTHEILIAAFLDSNLAVRKTSVISDGDLSGTAVDYGKLITSAVNCNTNRIIIAHNHPSGVAAPSAMDIETVRQMCVQLKAVNIRLCDSIIVAGTEYYSMKNNKKCRYYFE